MKYSDRNISLILACSVLTSEQPLIYSDYGGKMRINMIWIRIFGFFSVVLGIALLYASMVSKFWHAGHWFTLSSFFDMIIPLGLIVSGIGLIFVKPWARYLILTIVGIGIWRLVGRLITLGPCTEEVSYIIPFVVASLYLWFFNRRSIKEKFATHWAAKLTAIVWFTIVSITIIGAVVLWFVIGGHKLPIAHEAVYTHHNEEFYSQDYYRSTFPLKYTMAVPNGFTLRSLSKENNKNILVWLANPTCGTITISNRTMLQRIRSLARAYGYDNDYRFADKFFSEQYGLFFAIIKLAALEGAVSVEKIKIGELRGFVQKGNRINEYYLFKGNESIGGGTIFRKLGTERIDGQEINEIVSSIRPQANSLKSSCEFIEEGKLQLDQGDFHKAKMSLGSALCLDWNIPECHYYLGIAFLKTENRSSAIRHFREALLLQSDYPEAQRHLDEAMGEERN